MRRKILCAVLSLLMVVSLLPIVAGATDNPTITFEQQTTAAGANEVKVDVKITNNPGFVSATIPVKWDASVMTLSSITLSTAVVDTGWCGMTMEEYATNGTQGLYYLAWNNDTRTEAEGGDFTADGTLCTMAFNVKDTTKDTSSDITADLTATIANMMTYNMADLRDSGLTAATTKVNLTAAESGTEEPDPEPSDGAKMTVGTVKGKAGKTVDLTIKFESENGFAGMAFDVKYDNTVLTLKDITSDVDFTTTNIEDCNGICNFQYASTKNEYSVDNFATLTFEVNENAIEGMSSVSIVMGEKSQFYYKDKNEVSFDVTTVAGGVKVVTYIPGDANGDNVLNNRDAARILQYLAGWKVEIQLEACDTTGDGIVNNRDAARILQYLAGWNVKISD